MDNFLLAETRCGYEITATMKTVWKAQIEILEIIAGICKRHHIKYFLTDGSLLGAIRHDGYIPWDDDMDISMLRQDYDKFCEVAPKELPPNYFFQNGETDPEYCEHLVKIRNSDMTATTEFYRKMQYRCNQGMFVDVMPLDVIPNGAALRRQLFWQKILHNIRCRAVAHWRTSVKGYVLRGVCRVVFYLIGPRRLHRWYENLLRHQKPTGLVGHRMFPYTVPQEHWKVEWFRDVSPHQFEYTQFDVPSSYQKILDFTYGDWHKFVKGASSHSTLYFNTKESYRTLIPREFGYAVERT